MPKSYRPYLPDQDLLLPPSLREWLAEEHLVYFVSDVSLTGFRTWVRGTRCWVLFLNERLVEDKSAVYP